MLADRWAVKARVTYTRSLPFGGESGGLSAQAARKYALIKGGPLRLSRGADKRDLVMGRPRVNFAVNVTVSYHQTP